MLAHSFIDFIYLIWGLWDDRGLGGASAVRGTLRDLGLVWDTRVAECYYYVVTSEPFRRPNERTDFGTGWTMEGRASLLDVSSICECAIPFPFELLSLSVLEDDVWSDATQGYLVAIVFFCLFPLLVSLPFFLLQKQLDTFIRVDNRATGETTPVRTEQKRSKSLGLPIIGYQLAVKYSGRRAGRKQRTRTEPEATATNRVEFTACPWLGFKTMLISGLCLVNIHLQAVEKALNSLRPWGASWSGSSMYGASLH